MKSPIKFLAALALLLTLNFTANAQRGGGERPTPAQMAEKQTTRMVEKLSLDETQTAQIQEINLAYATKTEGIREKYRDDRTGMREVMGAVRKEQAAEVKTVLTAEQYKTFEQLQAEKPRRGGRKGRSGGKRGSRT